MDDLAFTYCSDGVDSPGYVECSCSELDQQLEVGGADTLTPWPAVSTSTYWQSFIVFEVLSLELRLIVLRAEKRNREILCDCRMSFQVGSFESDGNYEMTIAS